MHPHHPRKTLHVRRILLQNAAWMLPVNTLAKPLSIIVILWLLHHPHLQLPQHREHVLASSSTSSLQDTTPKESSTPKQTSPSSATNITKSAV
ncbi:hypothetical protein BDR26DRAFT_859645, partial [Obelidium mucronatum]